MKKRNIALITVFILIIGSGHLFINNKGNTQRVKSVIYTDKTIREKFGKIKDYSIKEYGSDFYTDAERPLYSYKVEITGEKKDGVIDIEMRKDLNKIKYLYTIKIKEEGHSMGFRIRFGKH
ncbi:hypothetical protein [Acinetobacter calcoaceticus]|uniref:hypothetical protein n=1 Tax=Acinetobacter calcoaceticus TaxID=471 RepID=UPI001D0E8E72